MVEYENRCVDCGLPCIGNICGNRNVPHYYCSECGEDNEPIYDFEGDELCIRCIAKRFEQLN